MRRDSRLRAGRLRKHRTRRLRESLADIRLSTNYGRQSLTAKRGRFVGSKEVMKSRPSESDGLAILAKSGRLRGLLYFLCSMAVKRKKA